MHRLIMGFPKHMVVDHIDGDGLNNRRSNLRLVTRAQNNRKSNSVLPRHNKSGFRGVCLEKSSKKWCAFIRTADVNRKQTRIGRFKTAEEAARAYDQAAKKFHGEFATLNFPEELL